MNFTISPATQKWLNKALYSQHTEMEITLVYHIDVCKVTFLKNLNQLCSLFTSGKIFRIRVDWREDSIYLLSTNQSA